MIVNLPLINAKWRQYQAIYDIRSSSLMYSSMALATMLSTNVARKSKFRLTMFF